MCNGFKAVPAGKLVDLKAVEVLLSWVFLARPMLSWVFLATPISSGCTHYRVEAKSHRVEPRPLKRVEAKSFKAGLGHPM